MLLKIGKFNGENLTGTKNVLWQKQLIERNKKLIFFLPGACANSEPVSQAS